MVGTEKEIMNKCEYYHEKVRIIGWLGPDEVIRKTVCVCNGTREQDVCSCGGDRTKCDFYPEVRQKALKEEADDSRRKTGC
jgi:hypothetical protein